LSTMPLEEGWVASHKSVGNALRSLGNTSEQVFSFSGNILSPVSKESIGLAEIEVKENLLLDMLRDPVISKWGKVFVADYNGVIVSNNILPMYKTNVSSLGFDDYNAGEQLNKIEKLENKKSILIAIPIEDIGCSIISVTSPVNLPSFNHHEKSLGVIQYIYTFFYKISQGEFPRCLIPVNLVVQGCFIQGRVDGNYFAGLVV